MEGANWLSFSDLMSSLVLIFILIMFYIMYQYFDMYETNMAEIARQQYDLDQANADLDEKSAKLTEAEQQMIAQQIRLDAAQRDLNDAESVLAAQQAELAEAQSLLSEKETEIDAQKEALDALGIQLDEKEAQIALQQQTLDAQRKTMDDQQTKLNEQQQTLDTQQTKLNEQQQTLTAQQTKLDEQQRTVDTQQSLLTQQQQTLDQQRLTMASQQTRLDEQQQTLEDQQRQIEQLVGLKTRIITSLSAALKQADISAQVDPNTGAIALKSDVLFATNKYELSERGKAFIDRFLPVYLDVLFSAEYQPYVAEVIIEGHTDTAGDYISNLQLSQRRALAVASYVLSDNYHIISHAENELLRTLVTANGRSFSDPILDEAGNVDMDASRRVVFKFRLTDEQMIQQLKDILENSDGE